MIQSDFLGWLSDPFKGLSDLQLGDQKVTLNHLEISFFVSPVGWPSPVQNTEGAWLALLMGVYAVWILFKLDLYMKREQRCGF